MNNLAPLTVESNFAVARQPIYHLDGDVFGYELLYRSLGAGNVAIIASDEQATLDVLANGIHAVSQDIGPNKRIFINFSRDILEKGYYRFLDRERFVLEVLETVDCDAAFIQLLESIRADGYTLALDDYVGDPCFDAVLPIVTYVKVDFLALREDPARLRAVLTALAALGKTILAEKVETEKDLLLCRGRGIPLAQGFYYCKPQLIKTKILDASQAAKVNLLAEVTRPDIDVKKIQGIIASDVSLSYKLLRYVNMARFFQNKPIESVEYAVMRLGRTGLVSWLSVNLLSCLATTPRDRELAFTSAVRGRFLALLDERRAKPCHGGGSICLLGLFSQLDTILGLPMEEAIRSIPLDDSMRQALLGQPSPNRPCLALCLLFERNAKRAASLYKRFGVDGAQAAALHFQALTWAAEMFRG